MLVPVAVHSVHQERKDDGHRKYGFTMTLQASNCPNDVQHRPKDADCKPATGNEAETFNLSVMENDDSSRYHLMSFAKVAQASKPAGCCFSIGYGDRMRPCCLSSREVVAREECRTAKRFGGVTAFHAGSCPASADEAADLIQEKNSPSSVGSDRLALKELSREPQGCCFSTGYG